jgi:hypothetical protein
MPGMDLVEFKNLKMKLLQSITNCGITDTPKKVSTLWLGSFTSSVYGVILYRDEN